MFTLNYLTRGIGKLAQMIPQAFKVHIIKGLDPHYVLTLATLIFFVKLNFPIDNEGKCPKIYDGNT